MKKILFFFVIVALFAIIPTCNAQDISVAEKAKQKLVQVTIDRDGNVHAKHIVEPSKSPKQIELINGIVSNLSVLDVEGNEQLHAVVGENEGIMIFPSSDDTIVEYDLDDVLNFENNFWKMEFRYLASTAFVFPEELDLVFANNRGVILDEQKGIMCHGCQVLLEYSFDEPKLNQIVKWEEQEFDVQIRTISNIDQFRFDQPSKSISFNVKQGDFVTTTIPLELLWEPYEVFLGDEKIFFHKIMSNGTHAMLNFKPQETGQITIIGTTVVPEFPIIAPLAIGFILVITLPFLRKINLH